MDPVWETLHAERDWGKYPATDLIQYTMRRYKHSDRSKIKVLELGCGAGANLGFFVREGFQVWGIDGAPSAIAKAQKNMQAIDLSFHADNLVCADFQDLPFPDKHFDLVVDYMAIYANPFSVIKKCWREVERVLRPEAYFFSRSWARSCEGADTGAQLEPGTSVNPLAGPCANMGVSHFFSEEELRSLSQAFGSVELLDISTRNLNTKQEIKEWLLWAQR